MPRKATNTQVKQTRGRGRPRKVVISEQTSKKRPWFKWGESYTNVLLGIVVVIIGVLFIGSLAKSRHMQSTSSISTYNIPTSESTAGLQQTEQPTQSPGQPNPSQHTYTVKEGDDLWTIAENTYHSGYNWVDIAKANNIQNPDELNAGEKLVLPSVTPMPTTMQQVTPNPTPQITQQHAQSNDQAITTNTYTIKPGDTLWDIAVRAYADGYKWTKLAEANNLTDPNLIFSGNVIQIPR